MTRKTNKKRKRKYYLKQRFIKLDVPMRKDLLPFYFGVSPGSALRTYVAGAEEAIALWLPWQLRCSCALRHVSSRGNGLHPANQSGALESLTWLGLNFPWESAFAVPRPAADRKYSHCLLVDQSRFIFLSSQTETVQLGFSGLPGPSAKSSSLQK